jgi:surface antigen
MAERGTGSRIWLVGSALLFSSPLMITASEASQLDRHGGIAPSTAPSGMVQPISMNSALGSGAQGGATAGGATAVAAKQMARRAATRAYGISCVPYAREVSGIKVVGNAWQWWEKASGVYARGDRPEVGSVLNFRSNGRMRLGHVAVVTEVINPREVVVDHANWPTGGGRGGRVSHDVAVVDVSEANNWSAVRVELDRDGTFGSVYPTYGFIYNRPDTGMVLASVTRPAPQPDINPVPSDLRPVAERPWRTVEEVAEARPVAVRNARGVDTRIAPTATYHSRQPVAAK